MIKIVLVALLLSRAAYGEVIQGIVLEDHSGTPSPSASVKVKNSAGTTLKEMDTDRGGRTHVAPRLEQTGCFFGQLCLSQDNPRILQKSNSFTALKTKEPGKKGSDPFLPGCFVSYGN
jgi:hypothetical protein